MSHIWTPSENFLPALRKEVTEKGLFTQNLRISLVQLSRVLITMTLCFAVAHFYPYWYVVLACAVLAGFNILELGFIMHDAGHRQCSKRTRVNDVIGYICTGIIGIPFQVWMRAHNEHHENPNHEDDDPDVAFPLVAFSESQVHDPRRRLFRAFISHQTWYYVPILTLIVYSKRYGGLTQLLRLREKRPGHVLDIVLIAVWHIWYPALLVAALGIEAGVLFFFVQQAAAGLFFGMVFAPNHKGMPIVERNMQLDFFTRQVVTSRNVTAHPLVDYLYGGLNYQIEHHLFPHMPRYRLAEAKVITERYCKKHSIPYHETTVLGSYVEIYHCLSGVAEHARALRRPVRDIRTQLARTIASLRTDIARASSEFRQRRQSADLMNVRLNHIQDHLSDDDVRLEKLGEWRHEIHEFSEEVTEWISDELRDFVKAGQSELQQMLAKLPPQKVAAVRMAHERTMHKLHRMQMTLEKRRLRKREVLERRRQYVQQLVDTAKNRLRIVRASS